MIRRGSAAKLHARRLEWLKPRLTQYANVPGLNDDVTEAGRAALIALYEEMNSERLIGGSSIEIQRETIRRLLSELRGEVVHQGHW